MIIRFFVTVPLILITIALSFNKVSAQPSAKQDSSDLKLQEELAAELSKTQAQSDPVDSKQTTASQQTKTARHSVFQNMNPNISAIGTVLGSASSMQALERNVDLVFQEGEFSFQAAVDPYAKADFFFAFGRHAHSTLQPVSSDSEEHAEEDEESGLAPELEEAYVTFLALPFSTQLKLGKFRSRLGKLNETHPHANNFIDMPVMYSNFFGPEGLLDEGASLSWLLPNSLFFQEFTFQFTSGAEHSASFTRAEDNRFLYLAHLKNFFDLNDNTTLEIGVTGLKGPNGEPGGNTQMLAADFTFKWKPLQRNRTKSFEFLSEFLVSKRQRDSGEVTSLGIYAFARYQLARRWFLGAMYDYAEYPESDQFNRKAYSGILQFHASEFEKVEIQYRHNRGNFFDDFHEFKIRSVFVIGAHGAHRY